MIYNNVTLINANNQTRVLLDGFNEGNDRDHKSGRIGIRSHNWLVAFFLRIFGKIVDIKTVQGKIIHLNKNSLMKWRGRHRSAIKSFAGRSTLPTPREIISEHKAALQSAEMRKTKEKEDQAARVLQNYTKAFIAKKQLQQKKEAVITVQRLCRGYLVRKEIESLKEIKKEIDLLKDQIKNAQEEKDNSSKKYERMIDAALEAKCSLAFKVEKLKKELEALRLDLKEKEALQEEEQQKKKEYEKSSKDNAKIGKAFLSFFKDIPKKIKKLKETESSAPEAPEEASSSNSEINLNTLSLEEKIELLDSGISYKEEVLRAYEEQIEKFTREIETDYPKEKEESLKEIQASLEKAKKMLTEKNKEYDALIIKMNTSASIPSIPVPVSKKNEDDSAQIQLSPMKPKNQGYPDRSIPLSDPMENTQPIKIVNDETKISVNHVQNIFKDVESNAHAEIKKLMQAIFDKFSSDIVKTWEFNANSGKFRLVLSKPAKFWVRPMLDNGKPDPVTPNGIVLMLGNNLQNEIEGHLDKNTHSIIFSKGFDNYCRYKKKVLGFNKQGEADGCIKSIRYFPNTQKTTISAYGKDRSLGIGSNENDTKKMATVLKTWQEGKIPQGDHEIFLSQQQ